MSRRRPRARLALRATHFWVKAGLEPLLGGIVEYQGLSLEACNRGITPGRCYVRRAVRGNGCRVFRRCGCTAGPSGPDERRRSAGEPGWVEPGRPAQLARQATVHRICPCVDGSTCRRRPIVHRLGPPDRPTAGGRRRATGLAEAGQTSAVGAPGGAGDGHADARALVNGHRAGSGRDRAGAARPGDPRIALWIGYPGLRARRPRPGRRRPASPGAAGAGQGLEGTDGALRGPRRPGCRQLARRWTRPASR